MRFHYLGIVTCDELPIFVFGGKNRVKVVYRRQRKLYFLGKLNIQANMER
jgi:hypothetical protein